jgi:coenzyme F420-reducing hydrogenase delta subunit
MRRTLQGFGLEPGRIRLVWASAAEGNRFASEVASFVEAVRALGPLHWGKNDNVPSITTPAAIQKEEVPA